jgi:riboflavin biosynthesis pyrimidine reductase
MAAQLLPLYPSTGAVQPAQNIYLNQRLHEAGSSESPFVYGSFVSSLDGRIAVVEPGNPDQDVLKDLTGATDFRLFQELQAQADCLITHSGYLRALAAGRLGNVLQIKAADLIDWRKQNGLALQPAIVIASASLDFPLHPSIAEHRQPLFIATGKRADTARVQALREQGHQVLITGETATVAGGPLVRALGERGYRSLYLLAGPSMLETMLRDRKLSRLYLTIRHRLLGGEHFSTLIQGSRLNGAGQLALRTLYHDADGAQWFAQFEPAR